MNNTDITNIKKAVFIDQKGYYHLVGFNKHEIKLFNDDFKTFKEIFMLPKNYINFENESS